MKKVNPFNKKEEKNNGKSFKNTEKNEKRSLYEKLYGKRK